MKVWQLIVSFLLLISVPWTLGELRVQATEATPTSTVTATTTLDEATEETTTLGSSSTGSTGSTSSNGLLYSDEALRRLIYVRDHPVEAICNLFASISQRIHETISDSKGMSLFFSMGKVVKVLYSTKWFQVVLIMLSSFIIVSISCLLIVSTFKKVTLRELITGRLVVVMPIVVVLVLNFIMTSTSNLFLREMDTIVTANQINPRSYDVWEYSDNAIVTDEEIAKSIFREKSRTTTTLGEGEEETETETTTLGEENEEQTTPLGEEGIKTEMETETETTNSLLNTKQESDVTIVIDESSKTLEELYELVKVSDDSFVYYTSDYFTPVHFERYDESVFYYFYDWITYQYYSYWANNQDKGVVIGTITSQMTHPSKGDEEFLVNLQEARKSMKYQSTTGLTLMYKDFSYCYNGEYLKDLFGLSMLFNDDYDKSLDQEQLWIDNCKSLEEYCESEGSYYYPLSQLKKSKGWSVYSNSPTLRARNGKYPYSSEYLTEYYTSSGSSFERPLNRVYGAFGTVEDSRRVSELTKFEMELNSLTEQMYEDVTSCCEQLTGVTSDDTMIFCLALVCTYDFNTTFSKLSEKVEPTGLDYESVSVDTILKCLFRTNTETGSMAIGESDEFYFRLLDSSKGGIVLVLVVSFWEIFLFLCIAMRLLVLLLITLMSLWLSVKPNKDSRGKFGLLVQCLTIVVCHCGFIAELLVILKVFPDKHLSSSTDFSVVLVMMIGGLLILLVMFSMQFKVLVCFIQDPLNFGGEKIVESLEEVKNSVLSKVHGSDKKVREKGEVIDETDEDSRGEEDNNHAFVLELLNEESNEGRK